MQWVLLFPVCLTGVWFSPPKTFPPTIDWQYFTDRNTQTFNLLKTINSRGFSIDFMLFLH